MFARHLLAAILTTGSCTLAGCTSIYNLKVPLIAEPVTKPDARVVIEDVRSDTERRPHRGKEIRSCERWYGDDTIEPSKLAFLAMGVTELTRSDMQIHIVLKHFEIVEYCEFVPVGSETGAAGTGFSAAPTIGDTVVMHLAGDVNGLPFDFEDRFDYGNMYRFPNLPSSSVQYRSQLTYRLERFVKNIANMVWQAEMVRNAHAVH